MSELKTKKDKKTGKTRAERIAEWNAEKAAQEFAAVPEPVFGGLTIKEALAVTIQIIDDQGLESGVCCCGESMEKHSSPMDSGHTPTDSGLYYYRPIIKRIDEMSRQLFDSEETRAAIAKKLISEAPDNLRGGF